MRIDFDREIDKIRQALEGKDIVDFVAAVECSDGHVHLHLPGDDKLAVELINLLVGNYKLSNVNCNVNFQGTEKIQFKLAMPLGDRLVFSAALRDFKTAFPHTQINLNSQGGKEMWLHNPYVDLDLAEFDIVVSPDIQEGINRSNSRDFHYIHIFREALEKLFGVQIPIGPIKPDVWLSEEEYRSEPLIDGPYWLITAGINPAWQYKTYPFERWQEVVRIASDLRFVQIGLGKVQKYKIVKNGETCELEYQSPILQGENVISMVGQTERENFRKLFQLFLHCEGSIGLVSSQMHMAAAFEKPCVVVAGAREPVWFTRYFGHQYINTEGCLPCSVNRACWKCNEGCPYLVRLSDGTEIPKCIDMIHPRDIVEAIRRYYIGGRLKYGKKSPVQFGNVRKDRQDTAVIFPNTDRKIELAFLASFSTDGGGEQSARKMIEVFRSAGWQIYPYAWEHIHASFKNINLIGDRNVGAIGMPENIPLILIGNDQVYEMPHDIAFRKMVEKASMVILVINWAIGELGKCEWLCKKLKAVIFHNSEKIAEWRKKATQDDIPLIPFIGAIDIEKFTRNPIRWRNSDEKLIIVKHGVADVRKYVTSESIGKGDRIHLWQRYFEKELDIQFYQFLTEGLSDHGVEFWFMQAPRELEQFFKGRPNFRFFRWNELPVERFLESGHIYVDRCSDEWRHSYPRTCAEAMAAGLPVIAEDRDGWADRIDNGDTGFLCVHSQEYLLKIKLLAENEPYRYAMATAAREYAQKNLDPRRWVDLLRGIIGK